MRVGKGANIFGFGNTGMGLFVVEATVVRSALREFIDDGFEILFFALEFVLFLLQDDFGFGLVFLNHEVELFFEHAHFLLDSLLEVCPFGVQTLVELEDLFVQFLVLFVNVLQFELPLLYDEIFLLQ